MSKWKCSVCGYIYDSEKGIPEKGIEAGTEFEDLPDDFKCPCKVCGYVYEGDDFEDLPDDWVCPLCGVGKDQFEEQ